MLRMVYERYGISWATIVNHALKTWELILVFDTDKHNAVVIQTEAVVNQETKKPETEQKAKHNFVN